MRKLPGRVAAIVVLWVLAVPANAQRPGSVDPITPAAPVTPAPVTPAPVTPAPAPVAPVPAAPAPAATVAPAAAPATEAAPAAKPVVKKTTRRHRHYRYRYWRNDPFYAVHPRYWFPFYPHRYRYYRHPRRYYHRPFFMFRW